ncbi:MAG TPA: RodZ domain-containing protein, partial [Ramlibacter sp.]
NDRHDLLPDAVFARALAASVCRTLKIDPAPVLARLPQTGKPRLVQDSDGLNAPFRSPRDTVASHWKDQLTRPVPLTVGALLVGALVVLLWPRQPDEGFPVAGTSSTEAPATSSPTAPAAGRETAAPPAAADAVAAPPEVMTASGSMAPTAAAAALPAPAVPAASAAAATAAATASAPAATGVIVFRASAESWIEVRDAKGAVPVRKLLSSGETAGASGAMPLQVTVGNAGATEVQVRGKPFDLRAITRDNVARFEVK